MNLLNALVAEVEAKKPGVTNARMVHFAFSTLSDDNAFISQIEVEELVPLLEEWCKKQREEMETQTEVLQ